MKIDEQLLRRVSDITNKGQSLFVYHPNDQYRSSPLPLRADSYTMWRTQCVSCLVELLGPQHIYTLEFNTKVQPVAASGVALHIWVLTGIGVLYGLHEDIAKGYLSDFSALVSAEVFSDLLTQADYLLQQSYKNPAASLCGAVLEDGLKRMAALRNIAVGASDNLSSVNQKCAQANVYSKLTFKKINVWTEVRNKADHGQFDEFSETDVREMISGVETFLGEHLR